MLSGVKPRVAIVGPRAIGSTLAAALGRRRDLDVVACARRQVDAVRVEVEGRLEVTHPRVVVDPARAEPVEHVLVATKAYDTAGAALWLERLCSRGAPAAIVQNGVEHRARFAPYLPAERIVPVIVDCPAERCADGTVRQRGPLVLTFPADAHGRAIAALFTGTGAEVTVTDDFVTAAWRKLCINAVGVLPALVLQPAGVLRDEELGEAARSIVRETIAVGRAEGARLDDALADEVVEQFRRGPADAVNSLHADRAANRPLELDARTGAIIRLGRKHGIPTPANQLAFALLAKLGNVPRE